MTMTEILLEYFKEVESVIEENPILRLEELLYDHQTITAGQLTELCIKIKKQWDDFAKYGVEMCIVLTEEECAGEKLIFKYDFLEDVQTVIRNSNITSKIYYLNSQNKVCEIKESEQILTVEQCSTISEKIHKIVFHLGMKGIDLFIDGVLFSSDNFMRSYKDLMEVNKMLSINEYEKLLEGFYEQNIRYDINKRYFLRKNDIPKEYHASTIEKYTKLLRNKPEELFQIDFVKYLKNHCRDAVIREYTAETGDRYDVLVLNEDNVYVFEIKWLGRSITTGMNVLEEYNNEQRAISGARQLLDYITNADTYKKYFLELPIYCAILLVFDARDDNTDIEYPQELLGIPNLDLSKRFFMEKSKIPASNAYLHRRR